MALKKLEIALLLAGGAAAVFAVAAIAAEPAQKLEDVQIGERGDILRVALICSGRCDVTPGSGVDFEISGVAANLDVDLAKRSALATRLTIAALDGASVVRIETGLRINAARVITCQSDSGPAPCIEYRFGANVAEAAPTSPAAARSAAQKPQIRDDGAPTPDAPASETRKEPPFIGAIILSPQPSLRDEPASGVLYLPQFAPPERLTPPRPVGANADKEAAALPANIDVARPTLISIDRAETLGRGAAIDIKEEAGAILGKSFGVGVCEGAKARLQGDAWALDAMVDLAFCKAADGRLEEADADFSRLLAYTPDNYEALVGRALVAIASGDREKGLSFYQDALNALPPIAESDRIVAAMARN